MLHVIINLDKAYLGDSTVRNIYKTYLQDGGGNQLA